MPAIDSELLAMVFGSLILLAILFPRIRTLVDGVIQLIGQLERNVTDAFRGTARFLAPTRRSAIADLNSDDTSVWVGTRVIGSIVFAAIFTALVLAEAGVLALVFESMGYGTAPAWLAERSNEFVVGSVLVLGVFLGAVQLDMIGLTHLSPLGNKEVTKEVWSERIQRFTYLAVGALLLMLLLVGVWRGVRTTPTFEFMRNDLDSAVPVISQGLIALMMGASLILAGWALKSFPQTVLAFVIGIVEVVCLFVAFVVTLISVLFRGLLAVALRLIRIPAWIGQDVINVFARTKWFAPVDIDRREVRGDEYTSRPRDEGTDPTSGGGGEGPDGAPDSGAPKRDGEQAPIEMPAPVVTPVGAAKVSGATAQTHEEISGNGHTGAEETRSRELSIPEEFTRETRGDRDHSPFQH